MRKQLGAVAMLVLLCLGCAAKSPEEQGKRLATGAGAAAGAGVLTALGNPCGGAALLVQGALEATGVNDALDNLGRSEPDPKFVAFMEELQRETAERRAARERAREARLAALAVDGAVSPASVAAEAVPAPAKGQPRSTEMDRTTTAPKTGQAVAENAR